jgi:hypothetical protein
MAVIYSRKEHEDIRCLKIFSSNGISDFCNSSNNMLPKFIFDCSTYKGIFESGVPTTFFTSPMKKSTVKNLTCNPCLMQVIKTGDLKHLLEHWKIIQILDPYLNNALHSVVESGILECLKCNAKLTNFEKHKNEFLHVVVEGPLYFM